MNPQLADVLTLGGTADYNIRCRFRLKINKQRLEGDADAGSGPFGDLPCFFDHSLLSWLNAKASSLGLPPIFRNVNQPVDDNGEVFLSKYFVQQQERNEKMKGDPASAMCLCDSCVSYLSNRPEMKQNKQELIEISKKIVASTTTTTTSHIISPFTPPVVTPPIPNFKPPVPLGMIQQWQGVSWMPRPHDCCYTMGQTYHCNAYLKYRNAKISGV